ncbi:MAG: hypothetical protein SVW02_03095 [Candidatus Nanohaloarchaea archaeon]|nr:hypothetical protein [Candidatus Nanohaloarchaea archaeon]
MVLDGVNPWLVIHVAGAVISVGSVTVTDGFLALYHFRPGFGKILTRVDSLLSLMVWSGFLLLSLSGIPLVLGTPSAVMDPMFRLKMLLTGLVFLNGIALNLWVSPWFHQLSEEELYEPPYRFERLAATTAAVSVAGWWTILLLAEFVL